MTSLWKKSYGCLITNVNIVKWLLCGEIGKLSLSQVDIVLLLIVVCMLVLPFSSIHHKALCYLTYTNQQSVVCMRSMLNCPEIVLIFV